MNKQSRGPHSIFLYLVLWTLESIADDFRDICLLLDKQIKEYRKKIKAYPQKERRLYDLMSHDSVTQEYVIEALDNLKKIKEHHCLAFQQELGRHHWPWLLVLPALGRCHLKSLGQTLRNSHPDYKLHHIDPF